MKEFKVRLGSNTGFGITECRLTVREAWVTIHQGSKFVQTSAKLEELENLRDNLTEYLDAIEAKGK